MCKKNSVASVHGKIGTVIPSLLNLFLFKTSSLLMLETALAGSRLCVFAVICKKRQNMLRRIFLCPRNEKNICLCFLKLLCVQTRFTVVNTEGTRNF